MYLCAERTTTGFRLFKYRKIWEVDSIQDFYRLKCPECAFFSKTESTFQNHALKNHPLSVGTFFRKNAEDLYLEESDTELPDDVIEEQEISTGIRAVT